MLNKSPNQKKKTIFKKGIIFLISFLMVFSFMSAPKPVQAAGLVWDIPALIQDIKDFINDEVKVAIQKAGSIAYQRTLSNALNKIAHDAANYIGAGGRGQSELFVTEDWGTYLKNIGDEAAGDFMEGFVRNLNSENDQASCEERTYNCYRDCYLIAEPDAKKDDTDLELDVEIWRDNPPESSNSCIEQCKKAASSCSSRDASLGTSRVVDDGSDYNSFNVCQPSSVEAKLKISLGLTDSINGSDRPNGPNCTGSEIINNWGEGIEGTYNKIASIQDGSLFANINDYFDPRGNDLGIYLMADSDMTQKVEKDYSVKSSSLEANQGWLDVRNIAGVLEGKPQEARQADQEARDIRTQNFGKTTGDILVDAANIFLNQLAMSAYNNVMRKLSDKSEDQNVTNYSSDPGKNTTTAVQNGESRMKEKTRVLIEPQFQSKSDYSILAELSSCPDPENPGYNNCVINDRFMQAVNEGITVGEAIENGYLDSNWIFEKNYSSNAYNNHFSLRNIKILRKYRVIPIGWEVAIEKIYENEQNPKKATLGDLISCFDETDKYDDFSSSFEVLDNDWCEGLIDPSWVLKAPLNYCAKEGAGGQILNSFIVPGMENVGLENSTLSELMVLRDGNYCADNQSCIKEGESGGCELYGYCTEEKRTWNFEGKSCSPISNTCQAFVNTETNKKIAYLQNTIDYANCNVDNAGCKMYSYNGQYDNETGNISWDTNYSLNLNNNLKSCNNSSQGCSEFLRVKPTWGSNLIIDSNFRYLNKEEGVNGEKYLDSDYWDYTGSVAELIKNMSDEIYNQPNYRAVKVFSNNNLAEIRSTENIFPKDLQVLPNQNYTLSADVYLLEGQSLTLTINPGDYSEEKTITKDGEWVNVSVTGSSEFGLLSPSFSISAENNVSRPIFYFKNIKFELSDWSTGYSRYGDYKVYQKIIPDYLESTCYEDVSSADKDYSLKSDAPDVCSNYTKKCNASEVGCNLYTGVYNSLSLPAQVSSSDYCANECVGYDMYIARATYFNPAETENIIPANTEACSIQAVGCNEFTNLDEISEGGENKEYYVSLKRCIKPNTEKCGEFYSWGDGGIGDLTRYTLQKDEEGNPLTVGDFEEGDCSDIYDLGPDDPNYNPDCREFVNVDGEYSYKLYSKVVTCSDNCYSYRLSGKNIDKNIRDVDNCDGDDKKWNSSAELCYVCKNEGVWSEVHDACIYQAIPEEGVTCQAQDNGCREYNGSSGSNTRIVSAYDFEGSTNGWYSNCENGVSLSSISNSEDGQSLLYNASATACENGDPVAKVEIGGDINQDKGYTLRFMARSENNANISLYFEDSSSGEKYYFNSSLDSEEPDISIKGGGSWQVYKVSLGNLEDEISRNSTLNIGGNESVLIDNITLTEITDRYYLKKGTTQIPDICYYDNLGEYQGPNYNLGCSLYKDKDNLSHALHNFTNLCSYDSVGCEQMIDTNNYSSPTKGVWNGGEDGECNEDDVDCVEVERDTAIYAIYDREMSCAPSEAGCSLMGQGIGEGQGRLWSNVSKINDPDTYSDTLCLSDNINCDEYRLDNNSYAYFKNPGNNVCVYKSGNNPSNQGKDWYKAPVKRCDYNDDEEISGDEMTGNICSTDLDCGENIPCITDNNDYPCSTSYFKTIGLGGTGGEVGIPDKATALCDANSSGCSEYIDPVSKFNPNLVINPQHKSSKGNKENEEESNQLNNSYVGWGEGYWLNEEINSNQQVIQLKRNSLYSIVVTSDNSNTPESLEENVVELNFVRNTIRFLQEDNKFSDEPVKKVVVDKTEHPLIFNTFDNYSALLQITDNFNKKSEDDDKNKVYDIEIKELIVDYQFKENVNKSDCSGVTNFNNGCVLLNERAINGSSGLAANIYNAFATPDKNSPVLSKKPLNANKLIKVSPDRTCGKWLTCTSYGLNDEGEIECYSLGECNMLNENNECANIIDYSEGEQTTFNPQKNINASGYAIPYNNYYSRVIETGINTNIKYDFENPSPSLSCSSQNGLSKCIFDQGIVKDLLVNEPENAPTDYPAQGKAYLKVNSGQTISPHGEGDRITLSEEGEYYLNFLLNTKDSGGEAEVEIVLDYKDSDTSVSQKYFSLYGWQRKYLSFEVKEPDTKIEINLRSDSDYPVYFDDINIEPVLQVKENKYIANDCRLYPTTESLSCFENNDSVLRNGLEGYCLEYDLANPNICQQWLPIDKISSSQLPQAKLGYTGKTPLRYCAEVNLNFHLLEKRKAGLVSRGKYYASPGIYTVNGIESVKVDNIRHCYYKNKKLNYCEAVFGDDKSEIFQSETEGSSHLTTETNLSGEEDQETGITSIGGSQTHTLETDIEVTNFVYTKEVADLKDEDNLVETYCGNPNDYFLLETQETEVENPQGFYVRVEVSRICVPINSIDYGVDSKRIVASKPENIEISDSGDYFRSFTDGWYIANGFDSAASVNIDDNSSAAQNSGFSEFFNADPPIRVYDANYPPPASEDDLKKIYSQNPDEMFELTCDKFVEVVNGRGDNMAQVSKISPDSNESLTSNGDINYNNYIRNIGNIPYGAASLPDDLNLMETTRIPLLSAKSFNSNYVNNNKELFAGRPYGCSIDGYKSLGDDRDGYQAYTNCSMIGYCSGNPDVYCLLDSGLRRTYNDGALESSMYFDEKSGYNLAKQSCGFLGDCKPLWTSVNNKVSDFAYFEEDVHYKDILGQVFLKSYGVYAYDGGGYSGANESYNLSDSVTPNKPKVSNLTLYYGETKKEVKENDQVKAGNFRLEFNTEVDPNQQPLKQIVIDWGDYIQVVIDEDHHPYFANPHSFYHYYSDVEDIKNISVKITDNWNEKSNVIKIDLGN